MKMQGRMFVAGLALVGLLVPGCAPKKITKVQDEQQVTHKDEAKGPDFSNVDTSDNASFSEASLTEELARRAGEVLQPVYFEYNSYSLNAEAISRLQIIGDFLKENPGIRILVEGNCDERGSSEYNMGLGENRARAVNDYLLNIGIDRVRIETTSYGKERPVATNCGNNDVCHQKNRRDEFRVLAR